MLDKQIRIIPLVKFEQLWFEILTPSLKHTNFTNVKEKISYGLRCYFSI